MGGEQYDCDGFCDPSNGMDPDGPLPYMVRR